MEMCEDRITNKHGRWLFLYEMCFKYAVSYYILFLLSVYSNSICLSVLLLSLHTFFRWEISLIMHMLSLCPSGWLYKAGRLCLSARENFYILLFPDMVELTRTIFWENMWQECLKRQKMTEPVVIPRSQSSKSYK